MSELGIVNKDRGRQLITFSGLCQGKLSATDIDGLVEYHDKAYLIFEIKCSGVQLPYGQELAHTRLCDDLTKVKPVCYVVAEHGFPTEEDIVAKECTVRRMRYKNKWRVPEEKTTLGQITEVFLDKVDKGEL